MLDYGSHRSSVTAATLPWVSKKRSTLNHERQLSIDEPEGWTETRRWCLNFRGGGAGRPAQCGCSPTESWNGPRPPTDSASDSSACRWMSSKALNGPEYARKEGALMVHASARGASDLFRTDLMFWPSPSSTWLVSGRRVADSGEGSRAKDTKLRISRRSARVGSCVGDGALVATAGVPSGGAEAGMVIDGGAAEGVCRRVSALAGASLSLPQAASSNTQAQKTEVVVSFDTGFSAHAVLGGRGLDAQQRGFVGGSPPNRWFAAMAVPLARAPAAGSEF